MLVDIIFKAKQVKHVSMYCNIWVHFKNQQQMKEFCCSYHKKNSQMQGYIFNKALFTKFLNLKNIGFLCITYINNYSEEGQQCTFAMNAISKSRHFWW